MEKSSDSVFGIMILVMTAILFFALARGIFVSEDSAINSLETQGYSDVKITDSAWFMVGIRGCNQRDAARFTATATNPVGQEVEIYVCAGWPFKGGTIRTK